ncbi:unnamed protein product, partial [Mesorhabditis spiculigera]
MPTAAGDCAAASKKSDKRISPALFTAGVKGYAQLKADRDFAYWVVQDFEGRKILLRCAHAEDSQPEHVLPEVSKIGNEVNAYGGGTLALGDDGAVYVVTQHTIAMLTPAGKYELIYDGKELGQDFADLTIHGRHLVAVCEQSDTTKGYDLNPTNKLIHIDLGTKKIRDLVTGADFYASPRISPDGRRLTWMQWNHGNMPWDETQIGHAELLSAASEADDLLADVRIILDGQGKKINYHQPTWSNEGRLFVASDEQDDHWNVYEVDVQPNEAPAKTRKCQTSRIGTECGTPHWQFDNAQFAVHNDQIFYHFNDGILALGDVDGKKLLEVPSGTGGYTHYSHLQYCGNGLAYAIATGPRKAQSIVRITVKGNIDEQFKSSSTLQIEPIRVLAAVKSDEELQGLPLSVAEEIWVDGPAGIRFPGWYYPPSTRLSLIIFFSNPDRDESALPPTIFQCHSGPTAQAHDGLDLRKQFFTSRGFAMFDINYRGSTGYGSKLRRSLYGAWGDNDREDLVLSVKKLIADGRADPKKILLKGGSAGGLVVMRALRAEPSLFTAAVINYGVLDLERMVAETPKFEIGYNRQLLGADPAIWAERSPKNHVEAITTPVCFFHGSKDPVVAPAQSEEMHAALAARGVKTALRILEGESHGYRTREGVTIANEGAYSFFCAIMGIPCASEVELDIKNLH